MTAVLAVLKIAGLVLAAVLALLLLILLIPVTAGVDFSGGQLTVKVRVLFVRLTVFPWPFGKKDKGKKTQKKKKSKKKKKADKKGSGKEEKRKLPAILRLQRLVHRLEKLAEHAGRLVRRVFGAIHIRHVKLFWPVHCSDDAAKTAVQYGQINALVGSGAAVLQQLFDTRFDSVQVEQDYVGLETRGIEASCKISACLLVIAVAALIALFGLYKDRVL